MRQHVYMVWDIYDGVRSGIADFNGKPHHFKSRFDDEADDYSEVFDLKRVDEETLRLALEQWAIYRKWEADYHSGKVPLDTHPGHGGIDKRYDELELLLKQRISETSVCAQANAEFTPKQHQVPRPEGCLLDMDVTWSSSDLNHSKPSPRSNPNIPQSQ